MCATQIFRARHVNCLILLSGRTRPAKAGFVLVEALHNSSGIAGFTGYILKYIYFFKVQQ